MKINLIVAVILMLITLVMGYTAWYILWGSYRKKNKVGHGDSAGLKDNIKHDSYCYPKVNDMMGYEFIHVVTVPVELTGQKDKNSESANVVTRVRGLEGISADNGNHEDDPTIPEENGNNNGQREGQINNRPISDSKEKENDYDIVETDVEINPYELEELNKMGPWVNRDYDDEISEEELNAIISNNAEMIDNGGALDPEALRVAKEQEALRDITQMEDSMENSNAEADARSIMDELNGMTESDIPDID